MAEEKLDVIIFGASGFTGKYAIYEGIKVLAGLKWGIAGRSREKLQTVLKEVEKKADTDLSEIPIFVADVKNADSLLQMARKCKALVNCCGPYRLYGEPVVKACIEAGTHHVDVSGEPQYMERMQLEYHQAALEKGVYVVSACGFDSIPADLGTVFLEREFDGVVNSAEYYLETTATDDYAGGAVLHYGTWESAIYGLAHANELRGLRTQLFKTRLPHFQPRLKDRSVLHKTPVNGYWALPFPGSDRSVVMRSQRHFYDIDKKRPVQIKTYVTFESLKHVFGVILVGAIFSILSRFSFGRKLLLQHPKFFSFGFVSHEGPSEKSMENAKFAVYLNGEGWDKGKYETLLEPSDQFKSPPSKKLRVKISGTNPGYGATCVAVLLCATTILKEANKMPANGGVYPPGAAYAKTSLIEQLSKNGYKFEVLK